MNGGKADATLERIKSDICHIGRYGDGGQAGTARERLRSYTRHIVAESD